MRKMFIQFYLLLISCFLVAVALAGLVYQEINRKNGNEVETLLVRNALTLVANHLQDLPASSWPHALGEINPLLDFPVSLVAVARIEVDDEGRADLDEGNIVYLEDNQTYYLRLPGSTQALQADTSDLLIYLHEIRDLDYLLLGLISLFLAIPVLLWARPHWQELQLLDRSAHALRRGELQTRVSLPAKSALQPLANSFNDMASEISLLLDSKQQLLQAVAHELRTPLARLRYRIALLDLPEDSQDHLGIQHDLDSVNLLIDELLLHARLSHPKLDLASDTFFCKPWLDGRIQALQSLHPDLGILSHSYCESLHGDLRLLSRALDNLLGNAQRYGHGQILIEASCENGMQVLSVHDNGPGIPQGERQRVLEPFYRLPQDKLGKLAGHGLGLAIVQRIMLAHQGEIRISDSHLGGCCITLSWPLQSVTNTNMA